MNKNLQNKARTRSMRNVAMGQISDFSSKVEIQFNSDIAETPSAEVIKEFQSWAVGSVGYIQRQGKSFSATANIGGYFFSAKGVRK